MQPGEALDVAAQIAVTLAGFAGIVVVFRPDSIHDWPAIDRFRLRLLPANSTAPLVSALVAMLLMVMEPPLANVWRWCSGFSFLVTATLIANNSVLARHVRRHEQQGVNKPLYYGLAVLGTIAIILQVVNAVAWNRFWPFFAGIVVHLVAAIAQFLRFIFLPHPARRAAPPEKSG